MLMTNDNKDIFVDFEDDGSFFKKLISLTVCIFAWVCKNLADATNSRAT